MCSRVTWSADWDKEVTAYQNGDYATALKEWTPLAEQGDADAQYNLGVMYALGHGVPDNNRIIKKSSSLQSVSND